ncbi:WG repeat-containing protein [Microcoleus sp. Pol11C2]|uniref:WG repeat-containing protein n=1 Tax=Microcoleus sp. Pol11C2 TaxID=3055389 RepID=UPI002FD46B06
MRDDFDCFVGWDIVARRRVFSQQAGHPTRIILKLCNARSFNEDLAAVSALKGWGYINQADQWAIAPQFSAAGSFSEGLATVKRDGKSGFINQTRKPVI